MRRPSLSLFTLLAAMVLLVGRTYAVITITPVTTPTQLELFNFTYTAGIAGVVSYQILINGVVVSPTGYTALNYSYLVLCANFPTFTLQVLGLDNTNAQIDASLVSVENVVYNYGCPIASAKFTFAGGNSVPVKSSQQVTVTTSIALASVSVFFNGIFVCNVLNTTANVPVICSAGYIIPCASLGANVPLEISAVLPSGANAPSPPVSEWTVNWVAGQCAAQLILLNLNGADPTVIPTNCIQFGLQLDPTDDPTLYYNFAIETEFPGALAFANILNECCLDLSVAGETIAEANQSAFLIGSWKVPCSLNLAGAMNFIAIFSRKTIGASSPETLSSSAPAIIGENAVCEVVLVNPTVARPACTGPVVIADAAGGYLQALMVGDVLTFSVKIGDSTASTYNTFMLTITSTQVSPLVIFGPANLPAANSCNVFTLGNWTITSAYAGATNVKAVLSYNQVTGAVTVLKTITMCLTIVPNVCPVSGNSP